MFRERVSGASFFVCTGWSTYPGASFGSVFQEQAPSCVPALSELVQVNPDIMHWLSNTRLRLFYLLINAAKFSLLVGDHINGDPLYIEN